MKLAFEDSSYIEIRKSTETPGMILVIISAKDNDNSKKKIVNCVEISEKDLKFVLSDIV